MKIGTKIITAFLACTLMTTIVGIVSINALKEIDDAYFESTQSEPK